jgi:hypothetical protein
MRVLSKNNHWSLVIGHLTFLIWSFEELLRAVLSDAAKILHKSLFSWMMPINNSAFKISLRSIMRSHIEVSFNSFTTTRTL